MTALSYSASPGGHYAEVTVSPSAVGTFALYAGSYNGYDIFPAYFAVANTNNALPVTVTFGDGSTTIIAPFSSAAVVCAGRRQARLTNNGTLPIVVTVFDAGHAKLYLDQYNAQSWQVPGSDNEIIVHFSETPIKNFGSGTKVVTSLGSNVSIVSSGGPYGGSYLQGAATTNSVFSIETFEGVDFTANYTIDFWFKDTSPPFAGHEIMTIENDGLEITYNNVGIMTVNGSLSNVTPMNTGAWFHVALVANGSPKTMKLYINGIREASGNAFTSAVNYWFYFLSATNPLTSGSNTAVAEIRIRSGAVWVANFTPPTEPYT